MTGGPATAPPRRWRRPLLFAVLCTACLAASVAYVASAAGRQDQSGATPSVPMTDLATVAGQPRVLFENTAAGPGQGRLGLAPLAAPDAARALTGLACGRADFVIDIGVCLTDQRSPLDPSEALIFDADDQVLSTIRVGGIPSRARVSPDGRRASVTSFVSGHSYNAGAFSTQTLLLDLEKGKVIDDLERFRVFRQGREMKETDFNFWGVTFADDNDRFYATLGTGDHRYLVQGSLRDRRVEVLRDDTECPSLSPDNRRIAYKKRIPGPGGQLTWRLTVLDLATMAETPLAETRSVDDQAAWLDDHNVLYGLRHGADGSELDHDRPADTWVVPADGTGTARLFIPQAWSAVVLPR